MIINHLIIALRLIRRHKVHTAINILGLALAMAVSIIILLFVQDDFRHEANHEKADWIYRVYREFPDRGTFLRVALTPSPLAASLKHALVEVEDAATVSNPQSVWIRQKDQWQIVDPVHFTTPSFFRIFSFNTRSGTLNRALEDSRSVVLTAALARKLFDEQNPIGKTIFFRKFGELRVAAVIENPRQTHLRLGIILPMDLYRYPANYNRKFTSNFTTYILAGKYEDPDSVLRNVVKYSEVYWGTKKEGSFRLQPLRQIWLHSDLAYDFIKAPYDIGLDYLMLTVAISILAMACFNYINIETARAGRRAGEVALRKAVGASRRQLIAQFMGEACVLCLLALFLAVVMVETVLPAFNRFTIIKELKLFDPINLNVLLFLIGTAVVTGVMSGFYPAILLSSIQPARALKKVDRKTTGGALRHTMVVVQFSISILLIIATLVLRAQLSYLYNKDPGYDPKHIVCATMTEDVKNNYELFKAGLLSYPQIISVTAARDLPNWRGPSIFMRDWEGRKDQPGFIIYHGEVDRDFVETMRLELVEGISFAQDDSGQGMIVNQSAVAKMGVPSPLGKRISGYQHQGQIIGVVKDYYYNDMRERPKPLVLKVSMKDTNYFFARISPDKRREALAMIAEQWRKFEPDLPIKPVFLEKLISEMYLTEDKLSKLMGWATIIALWISCLGLYGLTTFIAVQRSKEVAIRKSYGASIGDILRMLTRKYIKIVIAANLAAWPIAYLVINRWLATFEQRIQSSWALFALAAAIAMGVVLITVSYQAWRTASASPVEALRYE